MFFGSWIRKKNRARIRRRRLRRLRRLRAEAEIQSGVIR